MALGLRRAGYAGALCAWLGFTLPSALLMTAFAFVATSLDSVAQLGVLHGLMLVAVVIVALILSASLLIGQAVINHVVEELNPDGVHPAHLLELVAHRPGRGPDPRDMVVAGANLAQGNLGFSFANRQPVLGLILDRARLTLLLMLPALTLAAVLGVVLALAAAPRAGSLYDSGITALSLIGYSVPIFWLGQLLIILFAIKLRWLPAQGMITLRNAPTGWAAV